MNFKVVWNVWEQVNGPGLNEDGTRDGDRIFLAKGETVKEFDTADDLRRSLTADLRVAFPPNALRGTYEVDRIYNIEITEA